MQKIYIPRSPRITPTNAIIIFNICIRMLMQTETTITALRLPYMSYWKRQFEVNTGLSFENEINNMVPKLKRVGAIYFDSGSEQWEINDEQSFDTIIFKMLDYLERDYEDVFSLGGYKLENSIIFALMDIYKEELENRGINLFAYTE